MLPYSAVVQYSDPQAAAEKLEKLRLANEAAAALVRPHRHRKAGHTGTPPAHEAAICQRIHTRRLPVGLQLARLRHTAAMSLRLFALNLRQAREPDLKARLKDAEDALNRREREQTEQAPPISFCFRTISAARFRI
jgi:hypothetical protein